MNGTKWKDTLNLPLPQQMSVYFGSSKAFIKKIVTTQVVNENVLFDVKNTTNSQSDTTVCQFLHHMINVSIQTESFDLK